MKNFVILVILLLAPAASYSQGHTIVTNNPNQMDVQRNVVNDSTALILPDTALLSPYWKHIPGMVAYHGNFLFYYGTSGWLTPAAGSSGVPLPQLNDSLALYMRTVAYVDSIVRVFDSVQAIRLALGGYQPYALVTTFAGADNTHYPSALAVLNLVNTSMAPYLLITTAAIYYDSIARVNDSLAAHWAAIMSRVKYADSNSVYATYYGVDSAVTNTRAWALAHFLTTAPVTSVFGRTGAVVAASNDYSFAQIGSRPNSLAGYGIIDWTGHSGQYLGSNGSAWSWFTPPTSVGSITSSTLLLAPLSGTGTAVAVDLPSIGMAGFYGSSSVIPAYTVDGYGRITGVTTLNVMPSWGNIIGTPTTIAGYGITDAYTKTASDARYAPISVNGTVTSVTVNSFTPLFTTTTSNSTTTPSISFNLIPQLQNLVFASQFTGTGVPSFRPLVASDIPTIPFSILSGQVLSTQFPALTGDITTASGSLATLLKAVGTSGTYGDATHIPSITTDGNGRVTGVTLYTFTSGGVTTVNATSPVTSTGGTAPTIGLNEAAAFTWSGAHSFSSTLGINLSDAVPIKVGTVSGTQFATAANQKLAFYGSTPIVQPTGSVITALQNEGLISGGTINYSELSGTMPTTTLTVNGTPMVTTNSYTITAVPTSPYQYQVVSVNAPSSPYTVTSASANVNAPMDIYLTGINAAMTFAAPTGSWMATQMGVLIFVDAGTPETIAWNSAWKPITGLTLPTTTVANKKYFIQFQWFSSTDIEVTGIGLQQ